MPAIPLEVCLPGEEVGDPLVRPGGLWVSAVLTERTADGTRTRVVMWPAGGGAPVDLLVDPAPIAPRGLSGGCHTWSPSGDTVHVVTREAGIVSIRVANDVPVRIEHTAFDAARSWSTPSVDATETVLCAVADWSELWRADIGGGVRRLVHAVTDGFLMDADAPGGERAHVWTRPEMPWTTSSVWPSPPVAGVAVQQPRSTLDGRTRGHLSDENGTMNVVLEADHVVPRRTVLVDDAEHGGPTWGPGQRTWCPSPDGTRVAYTRNEDGFGALWVWDRRTDERRRVARAVHGCLSWQGSILAALRTGARTPTQLVAYDAAADFARTVLADPGRGAWTVHEAELVEPECLRLPGDAGPIPVRLYRPPAPHGGLIVWVHGGPTDQWQVTFRPRLAWWSSRGWTIAVVDPRGSTGHGRSFALALEGGWGDVDAADTVAATRGLQRMLGIDAKRTVFMGSSAGGLTVLAAASRAPDLVAAVVAAYPVVDLSELARGADPFETHYVPRLVGARDGHDPVLRERSAHMRATTLASVPVLLLHGDADPVVPLVHSLRLRDALLAAGGRAELEVFAGEGHGFRDPVNVAREHAASEEFLARHASLD